MPPRAPRPRRQRRTRRFFAGRGRTIILVVLAVLVVLFIFARSIASYYVDYVWYQAMGQGSVYWTTVWAKLSLFLIFGGTFGVVAWANVFIADRVAPLLVPDPTSQLFVDRYRDLVGDRQRWVRIGAAVLLGLMLGLPTIGKWRDWLLFRNYQSFGVSDPQFNTDVGFYVFRLPFLSYVMTWMFAAVAVLGLLVAAAHIANGAIRFQVQGVRFTRGARVHLSLIAAALALVKAGDYWLQRYTLTVSTRGAVHGATYTDVNAQLPAINLLILVCLLVAALFIVSLRRGGWRLPVLSAGLWLVVALVAGAIYPAVIQRFVVQPNVNERELPFIQRNIAATKAAMGLSNVDVKQVDLQPITSTEVAADTSPLQDVRLLTPTNEMRDRFDLDQSRVAYYTVNDLDPDRYAVEGETRQVLVAARELNQSEIPNKTWVGKHITYTHGCGIVAAPASEVDDDGGPVYMPMPVERPELYVGENLSDYAITNTTSAENPCPGEEAAPYEGTTGVKLDSTLRRLAFAIHFGEYNLFGSSLITGDSRILYERDIRDRVSKLAPFLSLDADPYPVVIEGRVLWVIDAFTTTSRYPYAQRANTAQLTAGSGLDHTFNYVRNSVKAVVDAYDGSVTLYVTDDTDPIIKAWQGAFPDLFTPISEAPPDLPAHFRYPEDLFRVQTNLYGRYQFDDAAQFFSATGRWSVAQNPSSQAEVAAPSSDGTTTTTDNAREADTGEVRESDTARFEPYYTMFHAPDGSVTFSLLRPFVPFSTNDSRRELVGYMTVSSDPGSYGKLTIYQMTNSSLPIGPAQAAADAAADATIATQLNLLDSRGSQVSFGNLQLVPVGPGMLYIRPVYVRPSNAATSQVFVRFVIVSLSTNQRSVMATSLTDAINELFPDAGVDLGEVSTEGGIDPGVEPTAPGDDTTTTEPTTQTPEELLALADERFAAADQALEASDLGEYARLVEEARGYVQQALALLGGDPAATTSTTVPEGEPTTTTGGG